MPALFNDWPPAMAASFLAHACSMRCRRESLFGIVA